MFNFLYTIFLNAFTKGIADDGCISENM